MRSPYFGNVAAISPLPPGYMEAATGIGRSYASAISGVGDSIASSIEKYRRDKEEADMLGQQAESLGRSVAMGAQSATSQREQVAYDKMSEALSKFNTQSLASKRATISGVMTEISMLDKFNRAQREQQAFEQQSKLNASQLAGSEITQRGALINIANAEQEQKNRKAEAAALMGPTTRQEQVATPISGLMDTSRFINQSQMQPEQLNALRGASQFNTVVPGPAKQINLPPSASVSQADLARFAAAAGGGGFVGAGMIDARQQQAANAPAPAPSAKRDLALPPSFNAAAPAVGATSTVQQTKTIKLTPEEQFSSSLQRYVDAGGQLDTKSLKELRDYFGANKESIDMQPLGMGVMAVTVNGKLKDVVQVKSPDAVKLEQGDKTFMINAAEYRTQLDGLEKTINEYGTAEVMSPKGAADLNQAGYKLAILYAKIVDPQSVAREGEVEAAKKYIIPLGPGTRSSTALAALKNQRDEIARRVGLFEKINGVKVPGFEDVKTDATGQSVRKFSTSGKEIK